MTPTLLLALALSPAAPALKDKPANAPRLVGEWKVRLVALPSQAPSFQSGLRYTFTEDGRWLIHRYGKESEGARTYTVDPKANPPWIDLIVTHASGRPARFSESSR